MNGTKVKEETIALDNTNSVGENSSSTIDEDNTPKLTRVRTSTRKKSSSQGGKQNI